MPNIVLELEVDRVDLVDEGANSAAFIQFYKRRGTLTVDFNEIVAKLEPEHAAIINEHVAKAKAEVPAETLSELETEKAKAATAIDELENMKKNKKDEEPVFEEVLKSLDPAVQEVFKNLKLQKEAAEAAARLASEKSINDEALAKAKTLKAIPVSETEMVDVIKSASPALMAVLKAANDAIEATVPFEEVGKSAPGYGGKNDAWEQIEKRAKDIATRDGITIQKAISVATTENPDLYRKYLEGGAN